MSIDNLLVSLEGRMLTIFLSQPYVIASADRGERPGGQSPTQLNDRIMQLSGCLQSGEKSAGQLREMLGLTHRHSFREHYLKPALELGLIERTIPDKPNSRLQKYRLTENREKS